MNNTILVADSGGTQTDWCFVDKNLEKHFFTTKSFHPSNWGESFFEEFLVFWNSREELKTSRIHFYGAGCLNEDNKSIISDYFLKWGFVNVQVFSDVLGACHSTLGDKEGVVAILGTGSVACHFDGCQITKISGGLGYLLGDEGSGYYFGKTLLSRYLNSDFSDSLMISLLAILGDRSEVLSQVYGVNGKLYLSSIPLIVSDLSSVHLEMKELHEDNIQLFISKTFIDDEVKKISIIGSYGFYNQNILSEILTKNNIKLIKLVQYPIASLADYVIKHTEESTK